MEKTPRYTQRERNMVLSYAAKYKDVIENKRTDAESNRKKDEVWLQIAKDFNARVYHQRSAKQLRQLYKNMKLLLKKDLCGEDKSNPSFMDLLNSLSQQDSVAQYIGEGAAGGDGGGGGSGGQSGSAGNHGDDFDDSRMPLYGEGMDTDVIFIKSETISDNEQTDNGMDCLDDDDDDDCLSPKAPEVCLEEEDHVLFPPDLRQLQQASSSSIASPGGGGGASTASLPGNISASNGLLADPVPRAASSPVCSTKTSVSSSGSYASAGPKPDITIQTVGHIRVGSIANINNKLQNGGGSGSLFSPNGPTTNGVLPLTAEQVQQHALLNGLGLSAVNPPAQALQTALSAFTNGIAGTRGTPPTLQLPRLQRGNNNSHGHGHQGQSHNQNQNQSNNSNGSSGNGSGNAAGNGHAAVTTNGVPMLPNGGGHHHGHHHGHHQKSGGVAIGAAGSFNGYNGLAVAVPLSSTSGSGNSSANSSGAGLNSSGCGSSSVGAAAGSGGSGGSSRSQQQELINSLRIEEGKRKIELINAQIDYWHTLTRKLNSQPGQMPNPTCLCHLPGAGNLSVRPDPASDVIGIAASVASSPSGSVLQGRSGSS